MTNALKFDSKATSVPLDGAAAHNLRTPESSQPVLPSFSRPYDWDAIDRETQISGGVILVGVIPEEQLADLNAEIDAYLQENTEQGGPESGSDQYDLFLGHKTIRLHGLVEKFASSRELIGHAEIVSWANRILAAKASSILLNAGELIQINPGEPHQAAHRDTDSWPISIDADPIIVNAIVALDEFTTENGATAVAPGSWDWEAGRRPKSQEYARAIMQRGDVLLFRADLIHGGGENRSTNRRRAISVSYCAGWLRTVENSYLNVSKETANKLPQTLQALLGYQAHDGADHNAGMVGLYENGDPQKYLSHVGEG